jgi:hypothetical protein
VAADRAAQLEAVARAQLLDQVGRHLAVVDQLDGQLERAALRRRRDRVRALRLVAVLRGQPDVDVLARAVPGPLRHVEHERPRARRLHDELAHGRLPPAQRRAPAQSLQ